MKNQVNNDHSLLQIKEQISNNFKGLNFDEETHTYTLNGKTLTSTTSYLSRFSDKFNSYFASEAKGKSKLSKNATDRRDGKFYRDRWKFVRDESLNMGNRVHLYAECFPDFDLPYCWREQGILDFFEWLPDNYIVLFSELRIYDEETCHAGTIDLVLYNKNTNNLVIVDWKTNKRNINEVYKNKSLKGEFKHLASTSYNKYSLQLSDYSYVLSKNSNFDVEERWVIWLRDAPVNKKDSDRNSDYKIKRVTPFLNEKNFKLYKTDDLSKEIKNSYNKYKKDLKKSSTNAKPKQGLFAKKDSRGNSKKKGGLFSKK